MAKTRYDVVMADEIEYKFLLSAMPDLTAPDLEVQRISFIRQCYIAPGPGWSERRIRWEHDHQGLAIVDMSKRDLTGTFANVRAREESDPVDISAEEADKLIAEGGTGELTKTRYRVLHKGILLELDMFHRPEPLYLLEIEVPEPMEKPEELVPNNWPMIRNVSDEDAYMSYTLAHTSSK